MSRRRASYRDRWLLWSLVVAYGVHVAEEWYLGFPAWVTLVIARPLPETAFVIINSVAMFLMIVGIGLATRSEEYGWAAVLIATIQLVNTAAHVGGVALTGSYAPGVVSALLLYVPLAGLVLRRAAPEASHFARGVVGGVLVHAAVVMVAFLAAKH